MSNIVITKEEKEKAKYWNDYIQAKVDREMQAKRDAEDEAEWQMEMEQTELVIE